jgi:2-hydroxychromene-2-carboxylate isomerase
MYWLDGRSTSDVAVAVDAAAALGFNTDEIAAGLEAPAIKARVIQEGGAALSRGVFGSPFMFIDGESFWGSDRLDLIAATK